MSRIGKKPIPIPSGVKVGVAVETSDAGRGDVVRVKVEGPKGKLEFPFRSEVGIRVEGSEVRVEPNGGTKFVRAYWGTTRALIANMVEGASSGFQKSLEIIGVGYQAQLSGKKLVLNVGYCHPVELPIPAGLNVEVPKPTNINIAGVDKQVVGEFAATVRKVRPPEPYKGKGIRYVGEHVVRKAGKAFGSGD